MTIKTIQSKSDWKLFHQVPHLVYINDVNWICPLESDVEAVFSLDENKAFRQGEAQCFVLLNEKNQPVGRIAVFIDHARNKTQPYPVGGIGFFECINDQNLAFQLFEVAKAYLQNKGVKAIDGPINFGERDKFWGLLTKGFCPPLYQENYQPPYYQDFFEAWGFTPFEQIVTLTGDSKDIPFERLKKIAQRLKERSPVKVVGLDFNQLEKYAQDFSSVYNAAFGHYDHFKPIDPVHIKKMMQQAKLVADPQIVCLAYYEDIPVGFMALFPDINPFLKKANGKLNWTTIPGFLLRKAFTSPQRAKGMGFGIHPDYLSKGIFSLLVDFLCTPRNLKRYSTMSLAAVRTHNKAMVSMYEKINAKIERVHITYRKAIEEGVVVEPFPFIAV